MILFFKVLRLVSPPPHPLRNAAFHLTGLPDSDQRTVHPCTVRGRASLLQFSHKSSLFCEFQQNFSNFSPCQTRHFHHLSPPLPTIFYPIFSKKMTEIFLPGSRLSHLARVRERAYALILLYYYRHYRFAEHPTPSAAHLSRFSTISPDPQKLTPAYSAGVCMESHCNRANALSYAMCSHECWF